MATPFAPNDIVKVTVGCYFGVAKQLGESVLYYRCTAETGTFIEDLPDFFNGRFRTPYRSWLPATCLYAGVSVQRVFPRPRTGTFYRIQNGAGTGGGAGCMPSQCSGLIRSRTAGYPAIGPAPALPGTSGRSYVPFVATTWFDSANNVLTAVGVSKLDAISTRMGPTVSQIGAVLGVYQPTTFIFRDATTIESSELVATQRRRGAFGQLNKTFGG